MRDRIRSGLSSWWRFAAGGALVLGFGQPVFGGQPQASGLVVTALALCDRASGLTGVAQRTALDEGEALADAAVAADPTDPVAHFAAFCTRGRRLESQGVGLSTAFELTRARRLLDTALALAPDYADALAAKGALLLRLPRLFGGDRTQGTGLLRRAIALAPENQQVQRLVADLAPATGDDRIAVAAGCE